MEIEFRTNRLRKACNDERSGTREFGIDRCKAVRRRLDDLRACVTLRDMLDVMGRGRLHKLSGDMAGKWSLDVDGPYRLIMTPITDDGSGDPLSARAVRIEEVKDTHG